MRDLAGVCDDGLHDRPDKEQEHDMVNNEEDYFRSKVPVADIDDQQIGKTDVQVDYYQADDHQESIRELSLEELL